MKKAFVSLLASFMVCGAAWADDDADKEIHAKDWQKKALNGITSLRYTVFSKETPVDKEVSAALADIGAPCKEVAAADLRKEAALSDKEARVKIVSQNRNKDKSWVGVTVEQKVHLSRIPTITFDTETYKVGRICPTADVTKAVKELCAEFVQTFQSENGKTQSKDKSKGK